MLISAKLVLETHAFACHFGHQLPVSAGYLLSTNHEIMLKYRTIQRGTRL
jgi:hypothetical protein